MKRIFVSYYSRQNFGDDLFVKLFSNYFSENRITLLCNPLYVPHQLGRNVHVSPWSWPIAIIGKLQSKRFLGKYGAHFLQLLYKRFVAWSKKDFDACITIGGSLFPDDKPSEKYEALPFDVPKDCLRSYSFNSRVNTEWNEFIIGANLGPVYKKDYFERMKTCFSGYAHVCLRDYASYYPFRDDPHVQYAPDVGFLHRPSCTATHSDTAIISIMDVSHHTNDPSIVQTYDAFIASVAAKYAAKGQNVVLLSLCNREGDEAAAQRILKLIPDNNRIQTYAYHGDISAVFHLYERATVVIATRFHSMIMGFVYNKPVFPIVYNCKMEHYLQDLTFDSSYATLETLKNFSADDVETCVICECNNHKKYAHNQFEALKRYLSE